MHITEKEDHNDQPKALSPLLKGQDKGEEKEKLLNPLRSISGSSSSSGQLSEVTPQQSHQIINQFQEDHDNDKRNLNIKIKGPDSPRRKISIDQPLAEDKLKHELSKDEVTREQYLRQMELELEEQHRKNREMINAMKAEEPAQGKIRGDTPNWRKKKVRRHALANKKDNGNQKKEESSDYGSELPGEDQEDPEGAKQKPQKRNKKIQSQLKENGASIPVTTQRTIKLENNVEMFRYLIYDGYRPQNLQHTREYIDFLIKENLDGKASLTANATPQHILKYLEQTIRTKLPSSIDEEQILDFDQNFECGNLDSVYLHNQYEYNMLMKVDTNTKGNTYWFMFKVSEFRVGQKYKFNIVNFTRNVEKFYHSGMNICVKREAKGQKKFIHEEGEEEISFPTVQDIQEEASWEYNLCTNIQFTEKSEVPRFIRQNKETGEIIYARYFSKLTFSYTFRDEDMGKTVAFAYSVPYGYTDLLKDLDDIKVNLMASDQVENYVAMDRKEELDFNDDEIPKRPESNILVDCRKQGDGYDSDDYYLGAPVNKPQAIQGGQGASIGDQSQQKKSKLVQDNNQKSDMRVVVNGKNAFKVAEDAQKPSDKKGENQKLSQYEIQHMNIKREALELKQVNQFERRFFEGQNDDKRDISQFKNNRRNLENRNKFRDQNFDIHLKTLLYRQEVIGQSICGLNIYQLTLTKKKEHSIKYKKKKVMYIQARLHAAETHGSLIMRKILQEFTHNHEKYDKIFHNYIVKIIPMINPDGVVIGNSRCSLAGLDLNRRWSEPNPIMHPEIFYIKNNMKLVEKQSGGISMFCDLHGHNKQMNAFIYGCNKAPNEGLLSWTKTRLLPKILASIEPIFEFNKCVFSQEKFKYNTARVVVWNEFKVTNSFTLETSMFGKKIKSVIERSNQVQKMKMITSQLTISDFDCIGTSILNSFLTYTQLEIQLEKEYKSTGGWLKKKKMDSITGETARQKKEHEHIMKLHMERAQTKKLLTLQKSQITPAGNDHKFQRSQISRPVDQTPIDLTDQKNNQTMGEKSAKLTRYQIQTKNLKISTVQKEPQSATISKAPKSFSPDKKITKEKQPDQDPLPPSEKDKKTTIINKHPKRKNTITNLSLKPRALQQTGDSIESLQGTFTNNQPHAQNDQTGGETSQEQFSQQKSQSKQFQNQSPSKQVLQNYDRTNINQDKRVQVVDEDVASPYEKTERKEMGTKTQTKSTGKQSNTVKRGMSQRKIINQSSFKSKKVIEQEGPIDTLMNDELQNQPLMAMNWMSFFDENEFETALKESKKPISKNPVQTKAAVESDSEPSCDNFDEEELVERFEPAATKEEPIKLSQRAKEKQELLKAELDHQQRVQIQKYVQQQKRQQEIAQQNQLLKDQEMLIEQQQQFNKINQNLNVVQKQNSKLSKRMDLLTQQITDQIIYEKQHQKKTINTLKEMTQVHQMPTHLSKNQLPPKFCQFEKALVAAGSEVTSPMPMIKLNSTDNQLKTLKQSLNQQIKSTQSKNHAMQMHTQPQKHFKNSNLNTLQLHEASIRSSLQTDNCNYNSEINHQQLKQTKSNIINQMFESTQSNQSRNPQRQFQQRMMQKEYSNQSSKNQLPGFDTIAPNSIEHEYNYKEQQDNQIIKNQNLELKKLIKSLSPNRNLQKTNPSLPQPNMSHQNLLSQSPKITAQQSLHNNIRLQIQERHNKNPSSFSVLMENPALPHSTFEPPDNTTQLIKNQTQQVQQSKGILNRQALPKNTISSLRQKMQEDYLMEGTVSKRESQSRMPKIRKALQINDPLQLNRKYGQTTDILSSERPQENEQSHNITDPSDDESTNYVMINNKVSPSEMKRQILENPKTSYQVQKQKFIGQRTLRNTTKPQNEMTDSSYSSSFIGDISPEIQGKGKRFSRNDPNNKDPQLALKMLKMNNSFDQNQQSDYNYSSPQKAAKIPTMRNHSYFTNNTKYKLKQENRFLSPQKSDREFQQIQQSLPPAVKANSSPLSGQPSGGKIRQINQFPKKVDQKLVLPQVISKPLGVDIQSDNKINQSNWDYAQAKIKSPLARGPNPGARKGVDYPGSQGNSIIVNKNKNQML